MSTLKHEDTWYRQDVHSKTKKKPDADKKSTLKHNDTRRRQNVHSKIQKLPTPTIWPL